MISESQADCAHDDVVDGAEKDQKRCQDCGAVFVRCPVCIQADGTGMPLYHAPPLCQTAESRYALVAKQLAPLLNPEYMQRVLKVTQPRMDTMSDLFGKFPYFFQPVLDYTDCLGYFVPKNKTSQEVVAALGQLWGWLDAVDAEVWLWPERLEFELESFMKTLGWKKKELLPAVRLALTAAKVSPPNSEVMWVLGKDKVLARLKAAATQLSDA